MRPQLPTGIAGRPSFSSRGNIWICYTAGHMFRIVRMCTCVFLLAASAALAQNGAVAGDDTTAGFQKGFLESLPFGPSEFPHIWNPYVQKPFSLPVLVNSPRLGSLIHDGKLELSLSDALALTLENNLDIVVQRYVIPF